jgi:hypothetical protein
VLRDRFQIRPTEKSSYPFQQFQDLFLEHIGFLFSCIDKTNYGVGSGPSPQANMDAVWKFIREYYTSNRSKCRYSILKISMFTNPKNPRSKFPCLKGKAAEILSLGPALLECCKEKLNRADPVQGQMIYAMQMSVRMEEILAEHPTAWKLPADAATEFKQCCYDFLALFNSLATTFQKPPLKMKLFNITIKCHYLLHGAINAKYLNPRLVWCYASEDYMSKIKKAGQSCVKGSAAWKVSNKMADKWLVGFSGRLRPKL